jgi:uncharacterized protein YdaU (DUF1376 family)
MAKAPAFQFYAAEYLADEHVQLMTLEEEGIYIRLLAYCWREGSVPSDIALLSRLCKNAPVEALKIVLPRFEAHPENPDRLIHRRLEKERKSLSDFHDKKSKAGKDGAKTRWSKSDSSAMRLPSQKNGSAINLPLANDSSSSSSATASSKNKKRDQRADKPRDPRLDHPALKAVIEVKGSYPHRDTWDVVIKVVGNEPDIERMRDCWTAWRLKNYAPGNLGWLVDWYVNGIPATGVSNGSNRESSTERNARNFRENIDYLRDVSRGSDPPDHQDPIGLLAAAAGNN